MISEEDYLQSEDFNVAMEPLRTIYSSRKWRLFALSCVRRIWGLVPAPLQDSVELAERFVDRTVTAKELAAARPRYSPHWNGAGHAAYRAACSNGEIIKLAQSSIPQFAARENRIKHIEAAERETWKAQVRLLRDIFGNPFCTIAFSPGWRTDTALTLARQMYDSRDFSALPILADALQDAGCDNADILDHCRGPGPHVRGCWCVDLVLGKE
jgi:hypothetical protein